MATEPMHGIYVPAMSDAPAGGSQIAQTGTELARRVIGSYANAAARDAAITAAGLTVAQKRGIIAHLQDTQLWYGCYDGTNWVEVAGRRQREWVNIRPTTDNFLSGSGFVSLQTLTIASAPIGEWYINFSGSMSAAAQNAGNLRIFVTGSGGAAVSVSSDAPCDLNTARQPYTWGVGFQTTTVATLTVEVLHQPTGSTNTIYSGARITAAYLGPR